MFNRIAFAAFLVLLFPGPAAMSEDATRVPESAGATGGAASEADQDTGALSAVADEIIPARKAGLWEIRTIRYDFRTADKETSAIPVKSRQQCTDAATDRTLVLRTGFLSGCPTRSVTRSGNAITIASACMAPYRVGFHIREVLSSAATHTTITGSFDSVYTISGTLTMTGGDAPIGFKMTLMEEAKWLGPCTADQKPGDEIWSDGCKRNVLEPTPRYPAPMYQCPQRPPQ